MRKLIIRAAFAVAIVSALAAPASAHERRQVGGYTLTVGWADEPTFTGFKNAVQVIISEGTEQPVVDLTADELKVTVSFGDAVLGPLPVEPRFRVGAFGRPGDYQTSLIPTRPGTYSFHFTGTIKGQPVDERFTSSETTFNSPRDTTEVEFPVKDPSRPQLASRLERVDPRLASARRTGTIGIVVGAAGIVLGLLGLALGRRPRQATP